MKFFLVFAALVAFAYSQQNTRCLTTPEKWHGYFREVDYERQRFRFAEMDYDATNKQIHIMEYERDENTRRRDIFQEWIYFTTREGYREEYPSKRCLEATIPSNLTFRPIGVLDGARFLGREWIGAEITGLGLEVDQFMAERGDERDRGYYHGSFVPAAPQSGADKVCIPVLESYVNLDGPFPDRHNVHYEFFNISTAIPANAFTHCTPS